MTRLLQIYKCEVCGNIVEMVHEGQGQLVCCNKPMVLREANTVDASREKHVPVIEKSAEGVRVKVGSAPHPMEDKHYIEWIELVADAKTWRQALKPGQAPEATFCISPEQLTARAYCNLHGLWRG